MNKKNRGKQRVITVLVALSLTIFLATITLSTTTTQPPQSFSGGAAWTSQTNAYTDGSGLANTTTQNSQIIYYNFSFGLTPTDTVQSVRVRTDYIIFDNNDVLNLEISTDGGTTWNTSIALPNSQTEVTNWTNITNLANWHSETLNDSNFRLRYTAIKSQQGGTWSIDYITVEVIYQEAEPITIFLNTQDNLQQNNKTIPYNYTPTHTTEQFSNCSLWDNSTGTFNYNQTNSTSITNGTYNEITKTYNDDGAYLWNVQCCDSTHCTFAAANKTIIFDTTNPLLTIISPLNQNYTTNPEWFNISSNEALNECILSLDNFITNTTLTAQNTTYYFLRNSSMTDGGYTAYYYCNDTFNNVNATETVSFNLDSTIPFIEFITPTMATGNYTAQAIWANVTATDNYAGLDTITLNLYNETALVNTSTSGVSPYYLNMTSLPDARYYLNATANDTYGNINQTETREIILDTTNPLVTIIYPLNVTYGENVTQLNYTITETNLDSCWYSLDGGITNTTHSCNGTVDGLLSGAGSFNWTIWANDTLGHESFGIIYFRVQGGVPTLTIYYPQDAQNYTSNVSLNFTAADDAIDTCWYELNGASNITINCNQNLSVINNIIEGSNTLVLWANDTDTNEVFQSITFFIDRIKPGIVILNPQNKTYTDFETINFEVKADENINTCLFTYDNYLTNFTMNKVNDTFFTYSNSSIPIGNNYQTRYWCNDTLGNVNATEQVTFSITAPTISVDMLYPTTNINVSQDNWFNISFNVTCNFADCGDINITLDPVAAPQEENILRAQGANEQNSEPSQNNFVETVDGSYPNLTCSTGGDRLSCDDSISELANSERIGGVFDGYGGVNITSYNNSIESCETITQVLLYYEFWGATNQHACTVGVNANNGVSWNDTTVICAGSEPGIAFLNVTGSEAWTCENFFSGAGPKAMAKAQAQKTGGGGATTWNFDVLYFNVSYIRGPLNKGIISTVTGTTPFYTNHSQNPTTITLNSNSSQIVNFWVNATGDYEIYKFFSYINVTADPTRSAYSQVRNITIDDDTLPTAYFSGQTKIQEANVSQNYVYAEVTVQERNELNITFNLYNNSGLLNSTSSTTKQRTINWTGLADGTYSYNVTVWDTFLNVNNTETRNITLDTTIPLLNVTFPPNNTNITNHNMTRFGFNVTDNALITCDLYGTWNGGWHLNQTKQATQGIEDNFTSVNVTNNGHYWWFIRCADLAGNINQSANYTFSAFFPVGNFNETIFNITQTTNDGTGTITLNWSTVDNTEQYQILYTTNLSQPFTHLNYTDNTNYTDTQANTNRRRFYRIRAFNPSSENITNTTFGKTVYYLEHVASVGTKNWVSFYLNNPALQTANQTLNNYENLTTVNTWNATIQGRVTCNDFSCPTQLLCTPTNCNFNLETGKGYEINVNSTAPTSSNWSYVGLVRNWTDVTLTKNVSSFGKNWVALYANTTLNTAIDLIGSISNADAVSMWNASAQTSRGLIPNPFPWIPGAYLGNFDIELEQGYETSVTTTSLWTQI